MRLLLFSDVHASIDATYSEPTPEGSTTHLMRVGATFRWLSELIMSERPEVVIHAGDTTQLTDIIHTPVLAYIAGGFRQVMGACERVRAVFRVLVGNHDLDASFHTLSWLPGETVVATPRAVATPAGPISLIPWSERKSPEDQVRLIESAAGAKIVVCHLPLSGAPMGAPDVLERGPTAFELDALCAGRDAVFCGHYHDPVALRGNAWTIGAVVARTFSDAVPHDRTRGAVMVDYKPGEPIQVRRIENPHSVIFRVFDVRTQSDLEDLIARARHSPPGLRGRMVARIDCPPELSEKSAKLSEGVFLHRVLRQKDPPKKDRKTEISPCASPRENLLKYLDLVDCEGLNKQQLQAVVASAAKQYTSSPRRTRMVKIEEIEIHGFLSIGSVSYKLPDVGITSLRGANRDALSDDNGSGKTALAIDALYWCLSGDLLTRTGSADDVVHDGTGVDGGTSVSVSLRVDGVAYKVTRTRKAPKLRNSLIVEAEGKPYQDRKQVDQQDVLDQILGVSFLSYLQQVVLLREGMAGRFTSLGYADRARVLEQYLDLRPYEEIAESVSGTAANLQQKVIEARAKTQQSELQLASVRSRIAQMTATLSQEAERKAHDKAVLQRDYDAQRAEMDRLKDALTPLLTMKEEIEKKLGDLGTDYLDFGVKHGMRKAAARDAITQATQLQYGAEQDLKRIETLAAKGVCDRCGAAYVAPAEKLAELKARQAEWAAVAEKALADLRREEEESAKVQAVYVQLQRDLQQVTNQMHDVQLAIERTRGAVRQISAAMSGLDAPSTTQAAIDAAVIEDQQLVRLLSKLSTEAEDAEGTLRYYEWWQRHLKVKGFRSFLLDQVVSFVNGQLADLGRHVFGDGVTVQLSSTRTTAKGSEKNEVSIEMAGFRKVGLTSSGERRRVDLLIQAALAMAADSLADWRVPLLVLDEVLDKLDQSGVASILGLLTQLAQTRWVLVTSHNPIVSEKIRDRWTMTKTNGVSTLQK